MNRKFTLVPLQRAWIAALRSGEYHQGAGRLYRNGSYCCLGVACKVLGGSPGDEPTLLNSEAVRIGLRDTGGEDRNGENSLTTLNDGGKTFAEIADLLERHPERYLVESR